MWMWLVPCIDCTAYILIGDRLKHFPWRSGRWSMCHVIMAWYLIRKPSPGQCTIVQCWFSSKQASMWSVKHQMCAMAISQPVTLMRPRRIWSCGFLSWLMCIAHLTAPLRLIDAEADRAFCVASLSPSASSLSSELHLHVRCVCKLERESWEFQSPLTAETHRRRTGGVQSANVHQQLVHLKIPCMLGGKHLTDRTDRN
jgi:hypothetical protein